MTQDAFLETSLVDWAVGLRFEDLPEAAIAQSKQFLLDTLAVAWAGLDAVGVERVRRFALDQGGAPQSRLWGSEARLSAPTAAWVNGLYAAALDFDSVHDAATMHPDIVTVPALLAFADIATISGREFIAAHVAGDELMVRLGLAAGPNRGWFLTSALGVFVGAALGARVLGLDPDQTRSAVGIALSRAAGSQQTLIEGSFSKRLQSAFAARDGVEAALLGRAGVSGPSRALTGKAGFAQLYTSLDQAVALNRIGIDYRFTSLTLKRFPSCFCNHAAILAALDLVRMHDVQPHLIESGSITLPAFSAALVGNAFSPEGNPQVAAQFSVQYSVACVLLRRDFRIEDIQPQAVLDPAVRDLAARFVIDVDQDAREKFVPATVSVRLKHAGERRATVTIIPGTPALPLSTEQLALKAEACFASGPKPMPKERVANLMSGISRLEEIASVSDVLTL